MGPLLSTPLQYLTVLSTQQDLLCDGMIACTACLQEDGSGLSASRTSGEAQSAYAALLEQAVSQLQLLGGETAGSTASRKAQQAAQERLYGLLEALAQVSAVQPTGPCLCNSWHQLVFSKATLLAKALARLFL